MLEEGKLPSLPPFRHLPGTGRCITKWKLHVSAKKKRTEYSLLIQLNNYH